MEFLLQTLILSQALSSFLMISELNIANPQETASLKMELSDLNRTSGFAAKTRSRNEMWGTPCVDFSFQPSLGLNPLESKSSSLKPMRRPDIWEGFLTAVLSKSQQTSQSF